MASSTMKRSCPATTITNTNSSPPASTITVVWHEEDCCLSSSCCEEPVRISQDESLERPHKRSCRRRPTVAFAPHLVTAVAPSCVEELTREDISRLWSTAEDLQRAKAAWKCELRLQDATGMYERQQLKRTAIFYTVSAYQDYPTFPEFIRQVSERGSGWAQQRAEELGFQNYLEVYGDPFGMMDLAAMDSLEQEVALWSKGEVNSPADVPSTINTTHAHFVTPPASPHRQEIEA